MCNMAFWISRPILPLQKIMQIFILWCITNLPLNYKISPKYSIVGHEIFLLAKFTQKKNWNRKNLQYSTGINYQFVLLGLNQIMIWKKPYYQPSIQLASSDFSRNGFPVWVSIWPWYYESLVFKGLLKDNGHIPEEKGPDEWISDVIKFCGDFQKITDTKCSEALVYLAYDIILQRAIMNFDTKYSKVHTK